MADICGSLVDGFEGFQQWGFVVQRFAGISDEDSRDAECIAYDESGRGRVPGGIAACLECVPDTAVRKTGCIRFLLDQQFAGELFDHATFSVVFDESVVLLGRSLGQRMEPVCVVGGTHFDRPFLHADGNGIGWFSVEWSAVVDTVRDSSICFFSKVFEHLRPVEYVLPEITGWTFVRSRNFHSLFLEGCFYYSES